MLYYEKPALFGIGGAQVGRSLDLGREQNVTVVVEPLLSSSSSNKNNSKEQTQTKEKVKETHFVFQVCAGGETVFRLSSTDLSEAQAWVTCIASAIYCLRR